MADSSVGGNSEVEDFNVQNNQIVLKYRLKTGYDYPYGGITFSLAEKAPFVDLRDYDFLCIRITSVSAVNVRLFFKTYEKGVTVLENYASFRHLEKTISFIEGQKFYKIPLKDFLTQSWWFEFNKLNPQNLPPDNLMKTAAFDLQFIHTSKTPPTGKLETCIIDSIMIEKDTYPTIITILISLAVYYTLLILRSGKKIEPVGIKTELPYEKLPLESYKDEDTQKVFAYIEKRCFSPGFSLKELENLTGLSSTKINSLLKNQTGKTFKKILNQLRLTEAKRLLLETDRQVIDIAFSVGYNNISYFNQVFRKYENCPPNKYRRASSSSE